MECRVQSPQLTLSSFQLLSRLPDGRLDTLALEDVPLYLHLPLVETHFDDGMYLFCVERLEDKSKGFGLLCSLQDSFIRVSREIDHRCGKRITDMSGSFDPVHSSL